MSLSYLDWKPDKKTLKIPLCDLSKAKFLGSDKLNILSIPRSLSKPKKKYVSCVLDLKMFPRASEILYMYLDHL